MSKLVFAIGTRRISIFLLLLVTLALAKILISSVTVSLDTETFATQFLGGSIILRSTPWGYTNWLMYQLWTGLPIDKSELLSNPENIRTLTLASSSLLLLLKLPATLLELLTGLTLYLHVKRNGAANAAEKVALVWFTNPYTILTVEVLGSFAILPTSLMVLMLLAFAQRRTVLSAALGALTLAVMPILALANATLWIQLGQGKRWKALSLHLLSFLVGVGAFMRWTTDLNLDPYRTIRLETPFSLAVTDFFADPYLLFGANIGIGTSLALGYVMYAYSAGYERASRVIPVAYGTVAVLLAFSTWSLAAPLLVVPYLCLMTKGDFSRVMPRLAFFLIMLLSAWTVTVGAVQLFRAGATFLFIPAFYRGAVRGAQGVLENATAVLPVRPFLHSLLLAALSVVSFASRTLSRASPSGEQKATT